MAISQQPLPMGTPTKLSLKESNNLDNVAENIYELGSMKASNLSNNGIIKDEGVTNLYSTETVEAVDTIYFAPNGDKLTSQANNFYVNGLLLDFLSGNATYRTLAGRQILDFAVTASGTWLYLTVKNDGVAAVTYTISEYSTGGVTLLNSNSFAITPTYKNNYATFIKAHGMTYATANVAYIYFTGTTVDVKIRYSGSTYTVFTGTGKPYTFTGLTAFSQGGMVVVGGVPNNTSMPQSYYQASPFAGAWTAITECSYLSNYEFFSTSSGTALNLVGVPSRLSSANYTTFCTKVAISILGVITITTVTQAGLTIIPSDSYTGFGFHSGRFKSTAATKFSPYIIDGVGTPVTITETVTDYAIKPEAIAGINTSGYFVNTYQGQPTHVTRAINNTSPGAAMLCEYGSMSNRLPVELWLNALSIPTDSSFQLVRFGSSNITTYSSISDNVVQINEGHGYIVDTDALYMEPSGGGHCNAFVSDIYLTGTKQSAYQTFFKYSNAVDTGSIVGVAGVGTTYPTLTTVANAWIAPIRFYESTSGTLFAVADYNKGSITPVDTTVAYVANSNIPCPVDAVYSSGGITLLGQSAIQTVNYSDSDAFAQHYAGYTLANQLPVAYTFFNLFGQLYGFDGVKIYRMPINGAVVGIPVQVALARGLTFIANSPTVAWFLSDFDNCIYIFTGGQKVEKWQEMTGVATVSSGVYSVKENSLYLQLADTTTMIMRDNIAQQIANPYTSQTIYATALGTYFVDTSLFGTSTGQSKLLSYTAGTGTARSLTWQSGYYGIGRNQYTRITQIILAFKVADPVTTAITINYKWLTANANGTETATFAANTYTVSSTGYVFIQYNPAQSLVFGASIGFQCDKKVTLYDVTMYTTDGGVAPIPNRLP